MVSWESDTSSTKMIALKMTRERWVLESRIGLERVADLLHTLRSREDEGGTEDPRVVLIGLYVMTYTQWAFATHTTGVATPRAISGQ